MTAIAVLLGLASAVCLAFGAHYQHGAVQDQDRSGRFGLRHLLDLAKDAPWLRGLGFLVLGMALNIVALGIAPVMVVQPMGAISLIVAVLIGMIARHLKFKRRVFAAVLSCVLGVGLFVTLSALNARSPLLLHADARPMTFVTVGAAVIIGGVVLAWRRAGHLVRIIGAGILFGCVAASIHLIGQQFVEAGIGSVSWECLIGIALAGGLGSWLVQSAYASGPPELVIAGLTVIDPIVAVAIGAIVLKEASRIPPHILALMILFGAAAIAGVLVLSRYHPDVLEPQPARPLPSAATAPRPDPTPARWPVANRDERQNL